MNQKRLEEIEQRLRQVLKPFQLTLTDDSEKHHGHAGAQDGRGHFTVKITAQAFSGKPLVERHRMIYTVLEDMMTTDIHALKIEANPSSTQDLIHLITETLSAHKAQDIKVLDVSSLSTVMDAMVICTATSTRHAASLADKLVASARKAGVRPFNRIEDQTDTGWILVDLLDVVVHIMLADMREFYGLEKLWSVLPSSD